MPVDIRIPAVGESITEGTLSRWFKKDGETVRADEPLYELETEKATSEIPSPAAGVLHIGTPEGQRVAIGALIGRIEESTGGAARAETTPVRTESARPAVQPKKDGKAQPEPPAMPAARRLAEEKHVDLAGIAGTGRGGRILKEDVQAQEEAPSTSSGKEPPPPLGGVARQRMSSIRQRIAERLVVSQKATASLTTFNEADMSAVMALRQQYKEKFQHKHGVGLGFMAFFVKAAVEALKAFPIVNARIDGSDIVYQHFYDIGIAVSSERGLMVPVVRQADRLSFAAIEKTIAELAAKAREGKIAVGDLQGGTFTITNGGVFGSLLSTPILNPPQSAILGMHTIQKRPVVVNDAVVVRPMMYLALTYDHRLIDGREAVLFLVRIKECIENPERLLLEV
jgi:2-oxoglutarate dehydrogenase E2 component (dihydrolipoamide succinyltransferase)